MDLTIAFGIGAGADSVDPFDFAKDALSRVSQIAVDLGARKKLCVAGCLAAELLIARKTMVSAGGTQLPKLQRRAPKLLKDLELSPKGKGSEERVRQGFQSFAKSSPYVVDQYF
ncbi:uncharacterized protein ColSpa_11259 [Colletotrichum spaethianum]|uniref:Uncharacterized protein n=1 Tax=Colletotrichum spaethianum TaxID=700344 RepID=A0AA37UT21_9PEZI|nr:uncharacterized protein ColSpa_11259 [Colletotrichum spaethianum]GKT51078.1 hypothetical protein ColSpa_11259 [Colletotrichum spaethianum]